MRITHHPTKPLVWWYHNRDLIDMSPPYQRRGRLWSQSDKGYLIDSIINGFDVPKLYIADFQIGDSHLNNRKLPYAIIDGKQRLEAVFDFFENTLVLNGDFVWKKDQSLKIGGLSLRDLRASYPKVAESFEAETMDFMSVATDDEADIHELFVRLNRSKPLVGAEIRNALLGQIPDIIRTVAGHEFFRESIKFSVKRAADYNAAAKLVLFEYYGQIRSTKKKDLDKFAAGEGVEIVKAELGGRRALANLDDCTDVFLPRDPLLSSAGILPVYYWLVRQSQSEGHSYLREFLVQFEAGRKTNREDQIAMPSSEPDPVYARYDTLNRSTNDVGSHRGRFELLKEQFELWAEERGRSPQFF